jgi:hypothetical protein
LKTKDEKFIAELIEERDRYLSENPHLKSYQTEIDKVLDVVGDDPTLRSIKLLEIISETIKEDLAPELLHLKSLLDQVTEGETGTEVTSTSTYMKYKKTGH